MNRAEARSILGIDSEDPVVVRAAFRARLLTVHPDVSAALDAATATHRVTQAYRLLMAAPPADDSANRAVDADSCSAAASPSGTNSPMVPVRLVDSGTLAIHTAREEALAAVLEAAHRLGELAYVDLQAGLVEVVVEFLEAPTSSVVMSLQGRATGETEVFCSVEPLSGGESPGEESVTRLLLDTIAGIPLATIRG